MNSVRLAWITLVLVAVVGRTVAQTQSLPEVERQIIEKWAGVRALAAELQVESQQGDNTGMMKRHISGTIEYALRDGRKFVRQELKTRTEWQDQKGDRVLEGSTLQVSDGAVVWKLADQGGRKVAVKMTVDQEPIPLGGKEALDALKRKHTVSLGQDTSVDGALCWQLIAKPQRPAPLEPAEVIQYLRQSDGILLRSIGKDANGVVILTAEYSNVRVNGEIPAERFQFTPPPGVQIVDQTQPKAPKTP